MSPAAALKTSTAAAALLGIDKQAGTLEAGKHADVVALPGDPLADIRATERPLLVMKGGKIAHDARREPR